MPNVWKSTYTQRRNRTASTRVVEHGGNYKFRNKEPATVRYWTETAHAELTIDLESVIAQLTARAMKTKSGRSALMGGLIKLKITKRVETDVRVEEQPLSHGYNIVNPEEEHA